MRDRTPAERIRWRRIMCTSLIVFGLAIILLALIPFNTIRGYEITMAVLAGIGVIFMLSRLSTGFHLWHDEWGYFIVGITDLAVLSVWQANTPAATAYRVGIGLMLVAGAIQAYASHIVDGGPRAIR